MSPPAKTYSPTYGASHALLIGINKYRTLNPLGYAAHDARGVEDVLTKKHAFPSANVTILLDEAATKDEILRRFHALRDSTTCDDRVVFFFAGHGCTVPGGRRDAGFLAPQDGDPRDLSSLIRWEELALGADLIPAKHILFLMDACYGGLALARATPPGARRYLRDMLQRRSRQVLTAGKADEVVVDSGGPLPHHSVFTGHLIQGLEGRAETAEGVLTAQSLMTYVYEKVAFDLDSRQTPHFGHLDGDGDLVFKGLDKAPDETGREDVLVTIPMPTAPPQATAGPSEAARPIKELLGDERNRILLHELLASETRRALAATSEADFPSQGSWSEGEFQRRMAAYEKFTKDLRVALALVAYWGSAVHRDTLTLPLRRMAGPLTPTGGLVAWIALRWYPVLLGAYAGGIAAVAAHRYDNLAAIFHADIPDPDGDRRTTTLVRAIGHSTSEMADLFKMLPEMKNRYTPRSDYFLKLLQPELDDALFLGSDYEAAFDEFEVLFALECAHLYEKSGRGRFWGPPGRFAWKLGHGRTHPLERVRGQAKDAGLGWRPLQVGLFDGSPDRFNQVAAEYSKIVGNLGWF